jgi:hypothetical protein
MKNTENNATPPTNAAPASASLAAARIGSVIILLSASARETASLKWLSCRRHACMTLHDNFFAETAFSFTFAVFRPSRFSREKWGVFSEEKRRWLGAESNRRHEDFQSSALPTELPSPRRVRARKARVVTMQ